VNRTHAPTERQCGLISLQVFPCASGPLRHRHGMPVKIIRAELIPNLFIMYVHREWRIPCRNTYEHVQIFRMNFIHVECFPNGSRPQFNRRLCVLLVRRMKVLRLKDFVGGSRM
jgi:hypothetical protein